MAKKSKQNIGEAVRQLLKERLAKHIDYIESVIKAWMQELSVPRPFVIGEKFWPVESEYIASSEKDADKNHMIHRHLRSRALWRNHSDWEKSVRQMEGLGTLIYKNAEKMRPGASQNYLQTILWAAFEIATGRKITRAYESFDGKDIAFYGHIIGQRSTNATKDVIQDEHWESIKRLSKSKEMADLLKTLKETEVYQSRIIALANKALLSSDVFYPCQYCKRLMKV